MPHDVRDQIVDFVRRWSEETEIGAGRFVGWLGVTGSKFYDWRERYGRVNEHNGWVPRDFWLEEWEKQAIVDFPSEESAGRLPAADLHDAGRRHRGGESVQRLAGAEAGGAAAQVEREAVEERDRASSSRRSRTSIGISTFPTSTSAARSTICAACWTATAACSCTGICANR